MNRQFIGMTDMEFTYEQFEETRTKLIRKINSLMSDNDKRFLLSFESAEPAWERSSYDLFQHFPSVQWKLFNLQKLKKQNPSKLYQEVEKLQTIFAMK